MRHLRLQLLRDRMLPRLGTKINISSGAKIYIKMKTSIQSYKTLALVFVGFITVLGINCQVHAIDTSSKFKSLSKLGGQPMPTHRIPLESMMER